MKTRIIAIAVTAIIVFFTLLSCNKSESEATLLDQQPQKLTTTISNTQTLVFKWKWSGGVSDGGRCKGGICGICPGICVKFRIRKRYDLTPMEIASGINYGDVTLLPNNKLKISPNANFDNGSGTVTIDENVEFGTEISNLFGKNSILLLQGTYPVNYNVNNQYGEAIIDISSN